MLELQGKCKSIVLGHYGKRHTCRGGPATIDYSDYLNYHSVQFAIPSVTERTPLMVYSGTQLTSSLSARTFIQQYILSTLMIILPHTSNAQCTLSNRTDYTPGTQPSAVAYSPNGSYCATVNYYPIATISVYQVGAGGVLTSVAGSPFSTNIRPVSVTYSPNSLYCAVANRDIHKVSVYRVSTQGALTEIADSPFATGSYPGSVT